MTPEEIADLITGALHVAAPSAYTAITPTSGGLMITFTDSIAWIGITVHPAPEADGAVGYATQRGVTPAYEEPPGTGHCGPGCCTCGGTVDARGVFHPAGSAA